MDYLQIANSAPVWIICALSIATVITQSVIFIVRSYKTAPKRGLSKAQCNLAVRTGMLTSIGPSISSLLVILSLVAVVGGPIAWMRLSMIGSASTELTAATVGAQAYGAVLGGEGYNLNAMATSWFTMAINGCGWLVVTLLFTHRIGQVKDKIGGTKTAAFAIVTAACNLGLCANMLAPYVIKLNAQTVSVVVGAASAFVLMQIAKKTKWLKPYVLGFSMIVGIVVGYFFM